MRLPLAAALVVLVAGCTSPPVPAATPTVTTAATDCGTFVLMQGEKLPAKARNCLVEAVEAGKPARLKMTRPTIEGDPIHRTYESDPARRVRVTVDSREDRFGSQTVTTEVCTGLSITEDWFTFDRCDR